MNTMREPGPVSVADEVAHWKDEVDKNPLWNGQDKAAITTVVATMEGKTKAEAVKALKALVEGCADLSCCVASIGRLASMHLRNGV